MYFLYYGACFWIFVLDGMPRRIQPCQRLCPVFPESRHWDVRHLVVQAASPRNEARKNRSRSDHTVLRGLLAAASRGILSLSLTLRPTVSRPVFPGMEHPSGAYDHGIYYSLTITVLFLSDALSDERTGLSFVYATGPRQGSPSWV
jgi:hypothetical protein